jgi:hypothetical protein
MTGNSLKSIMGTLFIFAMVLSPTLPSAEAGRLNHRGDYLLKRSSLSNSFLVHYQHIISYWSYACVCVCVCVCVGLQSGRPICPACLCCSPPPPGSCCPCCSTPIESESTTGSPWNYLRSLLIFIYVYCRNKLVYE